MTLSADATEAALRSVGLNPFSFDLESIAADLQARTELNSTLDGLVVGHADLDPVAGFDARWDS